MRVCPTFMLGGAVRGGDGGHSPRGTLEMFSSSCFLEGRGINKVELLMFMTTKIFQILSEVSYPHEADALTFPYLL